MIPSEIHDYVMTQSDDCFIALREQHPVLDEVIGYENFTELRDGITPNTYSVVLLLPTLKQCIEVKNYSNLIIEAHKLIPSSVLESFQIIYRMPNFKGSNCTEQVCFTHNFQEKT